MSDKYGFTGGGIELPEPKPKTKPKAHPKPPHIDQAVEAGNALGFVSREPVTRMKPGPKRTEPQDKVSIPGPKRVVDEFRAFCRAQNLTLWQGLEQLLEEQKGRG